MPEVVTLSQLESHLWEAANILRGPVDAADFNSYVFPLLFFERLRDVFDEETVTALAGRQRSLALLSRFGHPRLRPERGPHHRRLPVTTRHSLRGEV
jgi:hypothetical protein